MNEIEMIQQRFPTARFENMRGHGYLIFDGRFITVLFVDGRMLVTDATEDDLRYYLDN